MDAKLYYFERNGTKRASETTSPMQEPKTVFDKLLAISKRGNIAEPELGIQTLKRSRVCPFTSHRNYLN